VHLTQENSILIEFSTLKNEYPELYTKKSYRLLLVLTLHRNRDIDNHLSLELNTIRRKDNIDRVVLWLCNDLDSSTLHTLKTNSIDIIIIAKSATANVSSISHYVTISGKDHTYALALNLAADLLFKRLKKMFHLVLSEVAAPIYDQLYAKQRVATEEIMKFEEKLVKDTLQQFLPKPEDRKIAVDVGCGTGRHTFPLAKQFESVYAFDFSPLMIAAAERKKEDHDIRNVLFSVADLEYEAIRDEQNFQNNNGGGVDFIVASFGLGSFVEDTVSMMRRFHSWLREDGIVVLSFYNKQTILTEVTPNWRDTALSAHLDSETSTLRVELSSKTVFHIYCQPYSDDIQNNILECFDIIQPLRFPTLMALMPNALMQNAKARGMFRFVDEVLAEHKDYKFGHYVTVLARKKPSSQPHVSLSRVEEVLRQSQAEYKLLSHPPIVSSDDVKKHIDMSDGMPVKTLLFRRQEDRKLVLLVTPANTRVDASWLASKVNSRKLYFGSDRDVLAVGFPLGGMAPFAALQHSVDTFLLDRRIEASGVDWIYTGAGDNRSTLRVRRLDLLRILKDYVIVEGK
jgi:ubiquinone/menaquinone biosynthesis C-methylase UbiE/prolyl-tRNA editing enzyme YbaK/EbsC (Cys-tRNA(Pro) deacylase)